MKETKIMVVTVTDSKNYPNHFWQGVLNDNCERLIWFDLKESYFNKGKKKTEEKLINLFSDERPDFLFIFDSLYYDLDLPILLTKLKFISPKTKTVFFSGDDDLLFDSVRYLGVFFDYLMVAQNDYVQLYKKDNLKNIIFITQVSPSTIAKNSTKIYDVSFIGTPKADRKEIIEYLHKNGVRVALFGSSNWTKYPSLKKIYLGPLPAEDYLKTVNQTKINICLSKNMLGIPHMKGRFMEYAECFAFSLVEDNPQLRKLFQEGKEIIFFKSKEELLEKVKYYLKNEKERQRIAIAAHRRYKRDYDFEKSISKFIRRNIGQTIKKTVPQIKFSIADIDESIINLPKKEILEMIKDKEYISFSKGQVTKSFYKNYLQVYSLQKNKKQISCCDYFIHSRLLGDYARFRFCPFGLVPGKIYQPLLDINQIVVTKEYFLKNFEMLVQSYKSGNLLFVNRDNSTFVSLPLVSISNFRKGFFNNPEFAQELGLFLYSLHRELYSRRKKPILFAIYLAGILKECLSGKKFIFNQLKLKFFDKDWNVSIFLQNIKNRLRS